MLLRPLLARRRVPLPRVVVTCCRRWHSHVAAPALSLRTCTVSCAPSRQLTADSMSQWRVAGSGSRTVRSFLHTGHEKGTDEDKGGTSDSSRSSSMTGASATTAPSPLQRA